MDNCKSLALHPLTYALRLMSVSPLLLVGEMVHALNIAPGQTLNIDSSHARAFYQLNLGSTLNADGAQTLGITNRGGTVNLNGSDVRPSGGSSDGIVMTGGDANVNSSVITSNAFGMSLRLDSASGRTSTATLTDSTINAGFTAIAVQNNSHVTLLRSAINGTAALSGYGLQLLAGSATAIDSTITGHKAGVWIRADAADDTPGRLILNNSHVTAFDGPAILIGTVGSGVLKAEISVNNGSTLSASNGILMDVREGGEANLRVNNSTLVGDIVADSVSTATVSLENFAALTGNLHNVQSLHVNNSQMIGDVVANGSGTANVMLENFASLTGNLESVKDLGIASNARWVMVGDAQVENLKINGGTVQFGNPGEFFQLKLETLAGTGGTFAMHGNFHTGQINTLTVVGAATGSHLIALDASGSEPQSASSIPVVSIGSGDANFALAGGAVELGAYSYDLIKVGGNEWFLNSESRVISPGTQSVLALSNAAPSAWYGELSSLRSRMGEVRMDQGKAGGWVRTYGNKFNVDAGAGTAYQQVQQGLALGVDTPLPIDDGQWLVGLMGGYGKSDLNLSRGTSGTIDSYYFGAYSTWLDEPSGYYFDGVLKFNRFQNESDVRLSDGKKTKGKYSSNGVGASLEFGRHIKLDNTFFVEPFTQLSGLVIDGQDYHLENGLSAESGRTKSLLGKAGATVGRDFNWGEKLVQPYLRGAYVHEFATHNEVKVNDNRFNNDLSGSRAELGAGVAVSLGDRVSIHADFDYSNGSKIEQPWGANVGVRYLW